MNKKQVEISTRKMASTIKQFNDRLISTVTRAMAVAATKTSEEITARLENPPNPPQHINVRSVFVQNPSTGAGKYTRPMETGKYISSDIQITKTHIEQLKTLLHLASTTGYSLEQVIQAFNQIRAGDQRDKNTDKKPEPEKLERQILF